MGGVAHKPWTPSDAERALVGVASEARSFAAAGHAAVKDAAGHPHNEFKIALAQRLVVRTLSDLAAGG
jgi:xanthine dehydrogenase YagS FAD-binding subunit